MRFKQSTRHTPSEYEKALIAYWKQNRTFEKSVEMRSQDNAYVLYDGPPFITGAPHAGTLLSSVAKDVIPRYQTMRGKRVERVWGWDCHGLPAEVFTEKKLGIKDKRDIGTKVSLEDYIMTCRENMIQTGNEWEDTIERIGRWVEFKGAYKTMDKDYMESVWWAFKELYDKAKIYEGEKVLLYCTRDATPISKAEVAMDNSYQDVTDPTVYVRFKLADEDAYLLAWTTTPWTLPSNSAVAVNQDVNYAEVRLDGQRLIIAEKLLDKTLTDEKHQVLSYELIRTFKGAELVGKRYEPLFDDLGDKAHLVWHADFVHDEEGTGIAHESPAYGEEDYFLSKQYGFPWVLDTDESGIYTRGEWAGRNIWEANKEIAKTLHERGVVWKIDYIRHSYPHCHRCGTKLMYRAHPSWFMDIEGQRGTMLAQNKNINWFPPHIKHGRFEKIVESAPDWNLSRDRFWATAMPIWKAVDADGNEHVKVIGSYAELKELSGVELEDYHRPWIDEVTFELDGLSYKRIDKVLDCWFESGSMPFAQFHYPFENKEKFKASFPGDYVSEYVAQVRAWFYYLHAVNVGLFESDSFKNVIVTGTLAGNDGRKMSKSFGNYTDPNDLMDTYSADALRFLLLSSPLLNAEDFSLQDKDVADVYRKLNMIWNMYDFFTLYADVDGWDWGGELKDSGPEVSNVLDRWIVSRLHQLITHVTIHTDNYNIPDAMADILPFIDDASNWFVRRSRKRFWKSDNDTDKDDAYRTLHYVLVQLSKVLAPFTPFLAEELYQKLTGGESVHLLDWPEPGPIDDKLIEEMALLRKLITGGLDARAREGIKIRQPLAGATLGWSKEISDELSAIAKEELNVKTITYKKLSDEGDSEVSVDMRITPELRREGLMREVVRQVQNARKQANLQVDDRIVLSLSSENDELRQAIDEHADIIAQETLATSINTLKAQGFASKVSLEGSELDIKLAKDSSLTP